MPIGLRAKKKASQCLISLFAPAVSWRQKDSSSMQRKLLLGANKLQLDTERVTVRDSASNFNTAASIECWLIVLRLIGSFRSRRRKAGTAQPTDEPTFQLVFCSTNLPVLSHSFDSCPATLIWGRPLGGNILGASNPEEFPQVVIQPSKLFHSVFYRIRMDGVSRIVRHLG
jgi:hypothetical protein